MTLMSTQGHMVTGKNFFRHSVVKLCEANKMFMIADYVREVTVNSCKYGEYGSFDHLLHLFFIHMSNIFETNVAF